MELYFLLLMIFVFIILNKGYSRLSSVLISAVLLASLITSLAPQLSKDRRETMHPLLTYKDTCHLDYSIINSSSFLREKGLALDCTKILMLDEENSPLYHYAEQISIFSLPFLKNMKKKDDLFTILELISYDSNVKDLNNDGIVSLLEHEEYLKENENEDILLGTISGGEINCDRFNLSMSYCDYDKFVDNFKNSSDLIIKNILKNKSISFKSLKEDKIK